MLLLLLFSCLSRKIENFVIIQLIRLLAPAFDQTTNQLPADGQQTNIQFQSKQTFLFFSFSNSFIVVPEYPVIFHMPHKVLGVPLSIFFFLIFVAA